MIIILCLDNNNGMMFNDRRQSQDRGLREYIAEMTKGEKVYMNAYTEKLYERSTIRLFVKISYTRQEKGRLVL